MWNFTTKGGKKKVQKQESFFFFSFLDAVLLYGLLRIQSNSEQILSAEIVLVNLRELHPEHYFDPTFDPLCKNTSKIQTINTKQLNASQVCLGVLTSITYYGATKLKIEETLCSTAIAPSL